MPRFRVHQPTQPSAAIPRVHDERTHRYVEANLAMKETALAGVEAPDTKLQRFRARDGLRTPQFSPPTQVLYERRLARQLRPVRA